MTDLQFVEIENAATGVRTSIAAIDRDAVIVLEMKLANVIYPVLQN